MRSALSILYGLLLSAAPASASDYDKTERRLIKEPPYQTNSPKYVLLVFGPQVRLRVWVVLDGETLYLDRNGNGDLTEPGERFDKDASCKDVEIADPDRVTKYVVKTASSDYPTYTPEARRKRTAEGIPPELLVTVEIVGESRYWQYCDVQQMRDAPQKAMIAHFHGPLTIGPRTINWRLPTSTALHFGNQPDMRLAADYGVDGYPTGLLIDRQGRVLGVFDETRLEKAILEK